jgi:hypothetical protein
VVEFGEPLLSFVFTDEIGPMDPADSTGTVLAGRFPAMHPGESAA